MYKTIMDAIVTYLNDPARGFSLPFTAISTWLPYYELEKITGLTVEVYPSAETREKSGRGSWTVIKEVGVVVRDREVTEDDTTALMQLVEEIKDALCSLLQIDVYGLAGMEDAEPFDAEVREQGGVFSNVIVMQFQAEFDAIGR